MYYVENKMYDVLTANGEFYENVELVRTESHFADGRWKPEQTLQFALPADRYGFSHLVVTESESIIERKV